MARGESKLIIKDKSSLVRSVIFSVVFWLAACFCTAKTIYVDVNGPNDPGTGSFGDPFQRIESAIDSAQNYDIVIVAPGHYRPLSSTGIDFNGKAITVRSTDPNDRQVVGATIVDSNGTETEPRRGFYFHSNEGADSVLNGFAIINGNRPNGGGIYCFFAAPTITNCIITDNTASSYGGGINCFSASPKISNCIITGNTAAYNGGGIYCFSASPNVTDCVITNNTAGRYGGAVASSYGNVTNCTIGNNIADSNGGGLYNCNCSISNCIFLNNTNHAIYESYSLDVQTVTYCLFYDNPDGDWYDNETLSTIIGADAINALPEANDIIDADPLLKPDGYHLQVTSPCVNAGDPLADSNSQADIDNQRRMLYGRIDIGADEVLSMAGDFEPDGDVDAADLAIVSNNWLQNGSDTTGNINGDNIVNFPDFVLLAQNWMKVQKDISDLNQDGIVNFNDFGVLAYYWMENVCSQADWCQGSDLDNSSCVDFTDLNTFAASWLREQP